MEDELEELKKMLDEEAYERGYLHGLLAQIEMELKHPQMDGSQIPRAIALAGKRRKELR